MSVILKKALLSVLVEAQDGVCGLCRQRMDLTRKAQRRLHADRPTIDHVFAQGLGGVDEPGNVMAAHARCNTRKGGRYPLPAEVDFLVSVNQRLGWTTTKDIA